MGAEMKFARKRDIIVIAVLAAAGLVIWALFSGVFGHSGTTAEIYYKSELVKTVALTSGADTSFSIPEVPSVVFHQYPDGSIAFVESDCPDKICIRSGRLHLAGQMAACLPNQVYVKIVGTGAGNSAAPDIVIG
jgi:hypothetical protein